MPGGRPRLDMGHPLANQLVGAWLLNTNITQQTDAGKRTSPELVYGSDVDSLVRSSLGAAVARSTAAGQAQYGWLVAGQPSARLKLTERISLFWYGVIYTDTGANNPMIAGMYHNTNALSQAPFHSWGIYRPNNTDVVFSYNNAGSFGSLTASSALSAGQYQIPLSFSCTYGTAAVKGYKNGREVATGSGISGITYDSTAQFGLDNHSSAGSTAGAASVLALVWARELTPTEHLALSIDPFQVFVRQSPEWFAVAGAGGGPGPSGTFNALLIAP